MPNATEELLERLARVERQLGNVLRRTRIAALDDENARVRVVLDEEGDDGQPVLSAWLPWFTERAGPDIDWNPPEVSEQVMLLSPGGQTELGVVLHSVYQTAFPAPEKRAAARMFRFKDGSSIHYDREAHVLTCNWVGDVRQTVGGNVTQDVAGDANTTVAGATTLACPSTTIIGPLHVTQDITCDTQVVAANDVIGAGVSLPKHLTTGVKAGSDNSGLPE